MGTHPKIDHSRFPEQGRWLGKRVNVCFHFNTGDTLPGTIVREDSEDPNRTIIRLDDGRHVLATECHYGLKEQHDRANAVCAGKDWNDGVPPGSG